MHSVYNLAFEPHGLSSHRRLSARRPKSLSETRSINMTRTKRAWEQVEAITLADQVYLRIRDRIINRALEPGEYIREQEISRALGVSRTPVREAFGRLASQGFLRRVPHHGFQVPVDAWDDLLEVYPIVAVLEVLAGSQSFEQLDAADVRHLRKLNNNMLRARETGDSRSLVELNNAFHKTFSDASGNKRLGQLLDQLRDQVIRLDLWYFSIPENVTIAIEEHEAIIDAIEKREFDRALKMLEINYSRGRRALESEMWEDGPNRRESALPATTMKSLSLINPDD